MSHTLQPLSESLFAGEWPSQVTCRARTWHVLDRRRDGQTTTWRLAHGTELPRLIAAPPDHVVAIPESVRRVSRRAWARHVVSHARAMPAWWPTRARHLSIDMVAWQFVVSLMILSGHHRRVLLADDVGMGKTVQAALLLHEVHAREPDAATLVIAPAALLSQWTKELRARAALDATVLDATALRAEAIAPRRIVDASRAGTCWLISIDLLRQPDVIALLARTRWTLLVVDEAHLCTPGSARLEAVSRVARSCVRVLLVTACPTASGQVGADRLRDIGGRRGEVAMPIVRRSASCLARPRRRSRVLRVALGGRHLALCAQLDHFVERAYRESGMPGLLPALVLRRRAAACPLALVRSLERRLAVLGTQPQPAPSAPGLFDGEHDERDDEQAMRIRAWRHDRDERPELQRLLHIARQLPPAGARLAAVARLVRRCKEPVVVFTTYLDSLRALHPLLDGLSVVFVHGEQPAPLREAAVDAFVGGAAAVLLTTDASAEGLNLHHRCRLVVHAEVPRSVRTFDQRNGRVDRYGQTRCVHTVVMATHTTEDDAALARLARRTAQDDVWLADVQAGRCRRTEVATRLFDRWGPTPDAVLQSSDRKSARLPVHVLRPRRWQRLAVRLGLPVSSGTLWVVMVRASGGAELSATRAPACVAMRAGALTAIAAPSEWPAPLRGISVRAARLARRLERWESEAAQEALREATAKTGDLFGDATLEPRADRPATTRALSVTLEPVAAALLRETEARVRPRVVGRTTPFDPALRRAPANTQAGEPSA